MTNILGETICFKWSCTAEFFNSTCTSMHGALQKVSYVQMKQLTRQGWTINLLGIGIVRAAPLIIAVKFTADRICTTNGVRVEDAADHSWHHHYEDGQDLQKASKNGTCLGLNVVLSSQGTLNNHLEVKKDAKDVKDGSVTLLKLLITWLCRRLGLNIHCS